MKRSTVKASALLMAGCLGTLIQAGVATCQSPPDEVKKLRTELTTARRNVAFLETRLETCKSNVRYYRDACDKDIHDNKVVSPTLLAALLRWQDRLSDTEFQLQDTRDQIADLEQQLREAERRQRKSGTTVSLVSAPISANDEMNRAQDGPVKRYTLLAQGSGYTQREAEADAHVFARAALPSSARTYRVVGKSFRRVGDLWECSLNIEYFLPR